MKGKRIKYSKEEMRWLKANHTMMIGDYRRAFCAKFGRRVKAANLNGLRKRKGWKTGRTGCFEKGATPINKGKKCKPGMGGRHPNARKTQFKKGGLPHNTKHLGHERISKDGYIEISVDQVNPHTGFGRRYVHKHRWLWEKINGPVPKDMALKSIDGNRQNTDPSNWQAVPRALLPRLNGRFGRGYDQAPAELKATIMGVVKLEQQIRARKSKAMHQ